MIEQRGGRRGWQPNFSVQIRREVARVEVALPAVGLIIAVDRWGHHDDIARFQRDRIAHNALVGLSRRIVRFTRP